MTDDAQPLLTLEPFIEAVQDGITRAGWVLSGLQKTTSHQFEGRWEGESSRSAYLFFHKEESPEFVSIDVFLDETTKGLKGNLALVVTGPELGSLEPIPDLLAALGRVTHGLSPRGLPYTVRGAFEDGRSGGRPTGSRYGGSHQAHDPVGRLERGSERDICVGDGDGLGLRALARA